MSQGLPVVYYRKTDQKRAFLPGHGRVSPGHLAVQGVFRDFMSFVLMCLFCSLTFEVPKCVENSVLEASKLVSAKTMLLKHDMPFSRLQSYLWLLWLGGAIFLYD